MTCFGYTEKFPLLKDHVVVLLQAFAKKYNSTVTAAGTEVLKNAFERKMPTVLARINKGSPWTTVKFHSVVTGTSCLFIPHKWLLEHLNQDR